jgi:hypothetical protein
LTIKKQSEKTRTGSINLSRPQADDKAGIMITQPAGLSRWMEE